MTLPRETTVPALQQARVTNPKSLQDFVNSVFALLEVREGRRGDLDRNVTVRDLVEAGIAGFLIDGEYHYNSGSNNTGMTVPPASGTAGPPDMSVPPAPTGFTATAAVGGVLLSWTDPETLYSNHGYTEVWRSNTNDIGTAVAIGTADYKFYADFHGQNGATKYYWIRFVSATDVDGPYNATGGTAASTPSSPAWLLSELTGAITTSQLYSTLNSRIDLIDTPTTGLVDLVEAAQADILQNATDIEVLQAAVAAGTTVDADATAAWYFNSGAESWTGANTTVTAASGKLTTSSSGADAQLLSPSGLAIDGAVYNVVQARIKRISGSGWQGDVYFSISGGHGFSDSYKETLAEPADLSVWNTLNWEMDALTAGGTDWNTHTITQIRLDLNSDGGTSEFDIDYVIIGRYAPAASASALSALAVRMTNAEGDITASAADITALESTVNDGSTGVAITASNLSTLTSAVNHGTTGLSATATRVGALETTVNNGTTGVAATAAALDVIEAAVNHGTTGLSATVTRVGTIETSLNTGGTTAVAIATAQSTANSATTLADGKNATFVQSGTPTATKVSDTWIDTGNGNIVKTWNGSTWVDSGDARIAASASSVSTLQARVGTDTGTGVSLEQRAVVSAANDGVLAGQYSVKIDTGTGVITGFGLSMTGQSAGVAGTSPAASSLFYVSADTFAVGPPAPKWSNNLSRGYLSYVRPSVGTSKFIYVCATTPSGGNTGSTEPTWPTTVGATVADGLLTWRCVNAVPFAVSTDPATGFPAVFMDTAFIADATITSAKIASLAANKIEAGTITAALTIEAPTINAGVLTGATIRTSASNPRVFMDGSGIYGVNNAGTTKFSLLASTGVLTATDAVLNNVTATSGSFTGAVYASSGTFAGALSGATGTFAGSLSAATGTFSGALSGATGTFAGSLSAASGTFSGTISGATITGSTITGSTIVGGTAGAKRVVINGTGTNEAGQAVWYDSNGTTVLATIGSINDTDVYIGDFGDILSSTRVGIRGSSYSSTGVVGRSSSNAGVSGTSTTSVGVIGGSYANSASVGAVIGSSSNANGVMGVSGSRTGVHGSSAQASGVVGITTAASTSYAAIYGDATGTTLSPGVRGNSNNGNGVEGLSTSGYGGAFTGNATRAPFRIVPQAATPSSGQLGDMYVDSTTSEKGLYFHNGTAWQLLAYSV